MLKIQEAIVVEGRYDKIKLSSIVDTTILVTSGFRIFNDDAKLELIRHLARTCGIIIFTDSDAAGFVIRNYLKSAITEGTVKHAYAPEIVGKERRKGKSSKEGKLGVEGIQSKDILRAISCATVFVGNDPNKNTDKLITQGDLYELGLIGQTNSLRKRQLLLKRLKLPIYMSSKDIIKVIGSYVTYEEFYDIVQNAIDV